MDVRLSRRVRAMGAIQTHQQHILIAVVGLFLASLVIGPLAVMFIMTFQPDTVLPFPIKKFSLDSYSAVFGQWVTYRLLFSTAIYALGSLAVGLTLAIILGWLVGRTDLPLRNLTYGLVFASFGVPGLIVGLGWGVAASPRAGMLNVLIRNVFGLDGNSGPLNVYSWPGLILVTGFSIAPSIFILLSTLFERMDPNLENASLVSGANRITTLRRVTLPVLRPGLLTVMVYYLTVLIQSFEVPLALGLPARIPVLSTRIYVLSQPEFGRIDYSFASTFGIIALVIGLGLMAVYFSLTRLERRFQVITGKGYRPDRIRLGKWKPLAVAVVLIILLGKVAVPVLALAITAIYPLGVMPWDNWGAGSVDAFRIIFTSSKILRSLSNTALLIIITPTIGVIIAALVAWLSRRSKVKGARLLDQIAFLPLPIPGIVMALGLLLIFVRTPLWGSIWIIVLALVVNFQPFGVRLISASLAQVSNELEDVGLTSGAGPMTNFRHIVVPLVLPALRSSWMWMFAHSARDFTYPIMFRSTQNLVIASVIWEMWQEPRNNPQAAGLALLMVGFLWIMSFAVRRGSDHVT